MLVFLIVVVGGVITLIAYITMTVVLPAEPPSNSMRHTSPSQNKRGPTLS